MAVNSNKPCPKKPVATPAPTAKPAVTPAPTAKPTVTPAPTTAPTTGSYSAFQKKVLELVNVERANNGLNPLTMSAPLSKTATLKSCIPDLNVTRSVVLFPVPYKVQFAA